MSDLRIRLERARRLHAAERWDEACDAFSAVDAIEPLGARDLERLAESAQVMGRGDLAIATLRRAYDASAGAGDVDRAITIGFWLWQALIINGEFARANGWAMHMRRLVGGNPQHRDSVPSEARGRPVREPGWLLVTDAYGLIGAGRYDEAGRVLETAADLGTRLAEADLSAFATTMWGRALVLAGRLEDGLQHLDEAMVAIVDRDTTPRATSMLYCGAIATCLEAHEWSRAREWTAALGDWLDGLPDESGVYLGNCRIYRSMIWMLAGDWPQALHELDRVCRELHDGFGQRVAGHAFYELGELHRRLGDPAAADDFRRARDRGFEEQPGLALLRLSEGETTAAAAGIRCALVEVTDPLARLGLLPAAVRIMLAAGDVDGAAAATSEIGSLAEVFDTPVVRAELAQAGGAVALARGDVHSALALSRAAARRWRELDSPYAVASAGVQVALACRQLGDDEAAEAELESARATFARLGALPDVRRVEAQQREADRTSPPPSDAPTHSLTSRELEVLALVATGASNREIARRLYVSDRTVDRHVSNIFAKLGVRSRAAAAATAIRDRMVPAG